MKDHLHWSIIKTFARKHEFGFSLKDVVREFPENKPRNLARLLSNMVRLGMLGNLPRNNYHIIPLHADPKTYVPAEHLVAKYMMKNQEYYIGYASALLIHGLSLRSYEREYVVTKQQMKPALLTFGKTTYRCVQHGTNRFFGFRLDAENGLIRINPHTKPYLKGFDFNDAFAQLQFLPEITRHGQRRIELHSYPADFA